MVQRRFWLDSIERAWRTRSILWLTGVRRSGKTWLCRSLPNIEYLDCELPRVRRMLEDPESFLGGLGRRRGPRLVLDEIHRLPNPSELLKIAADHFPRVKIVATGSSTLGASSRFRDTLAGRKNTLWLTPMMSADLDDFGRTDLKHRLQRGGLPPFFLSRSLPSRDFEEWMDAFWARDVQQVFRVERRHGFQRFVELLMAQSGGLFEATSFARPCEVSRTTISSYLRVLERTHVATVLRPFASRRPTEIVSAPKVYGFDTGFVCHHRGWDTLRPEDEGQLWEQYVLNELQARTDATDLRYWRDKRGHEVDFVLARRGRDPVALECKWKAERFEPENLLAFRRQYPHGVNLLVASDVERSYTKRFGDVPVQVIGLGQLARAVQSASRRRSQAR